MNRTVLVLMMAVTVEALIEYAKTFGRAIIEKQWKTAATQAGAVALIPRKDDEDSWLPRNEPRPSDGLPGLLHHRKMQDTRA